jgi:hypothetical protein
MKGWNSGLFVNFGQFLVTGSGSAFPERIWIQESQINADPSVPRSTTMAPRIVKHIIERMLVNNDKFNLF